LVLSVSPLNSLNHQKTYNYDSFYEGYNPLRSGLNTPFTSPQGSLAVAAFWPSFGFFRIRPDEAPVSDKATTVLKVPGDMKKK